MKEAKKKAPVVQNKQSFGVYMKRYWQLYVLLALPMLYLLIFKYIPMIYIQIAFKKYSTQTSHIKNGICSLKNQYFSSQNSAQAAAEPHSNAFCMYFGSR